MRALYEILENRFNGTTWSLHELMIGFSNDSGYIGRLLLARDVTWDIDGDADAELRHKLAEVMWWLFVLADKLDIDLEAAFADTMSTLRAGLESTVGRTGGRTGIGMTSLTAYDHADDEPQLVLAPRATFIAVAGAGSPATPVWHRKKRLVADIARQLAAKGLAPEGPVAEHMRYSFLDSMPAANIADFYSVNPLTELHYHALARVHDEVSPEDIAQARREARSGSDDDDAFEIVVIPEQLVVQMMHHGPFSGELENLARFGAAAERFGVERSGPHQEIHLDPFTLDTPQDSLRTILRDPVAPRRHPAASS